MGFFSDLKEDLSQAVNELMPDEEKETTKQEDAPVSLDEMLENIDAIKLDEAVQAEETAEEVNTEEVNTEEAEPEEDAELSDVDIESMLESVLAAEPAEEENIAKESKGEDKIMDSFSTRTVSDETAIITGGMTITGDIVSEGSVDVIGCVNGNIDILGKLNVTGHINGNSKSSEIYAEGAKINGMVESQGAVKIGASSVIIGNISATSAVIAGAVKGDIDVKGPVILDASAIVMGNIKSKSVQINNGAVIEGMCSQCYADVSPTSFFDEYKPEVKKTRQK